MTQYLPERTTEVHKLGVAYNVFDGIENLKYSIDSIRRSVDYICAVYQRLSNHGNPIDTDFEGILKSLGVVAIEYNYQPIKNPAHNEKIKREIGRKNCENAGCNLFMTMDCDELYIPSQFEYAKKEFISGGFDSSACQMQTYWKNFDTVFDPPESYYVPFIYRLDGRLFTDARWPVSADPTRRMEPGKLKLFERKTIEMHHLSHIRDNYRVKLVNSSASVNWNGDIDKMVNYHDNWQWPQPAFYANGLNGLKKVDNVLERIMIDKQTFFKDVK
jgi:hypothetical protein